MVAVYGATVQAARDSRSEERQRKCYSYGLLMAAKKGCFDRVRDLLDQYHPYTAAVDIETRNKHGNNALIKAAEYGQTEIVRFLIGVGAKINVRNNYNDTALTEAAEYGRAEVVKLLIEAGADLSFRDRDGQTALMKAVKYGHTEIAKLLIEAGAQG